jgi:hypothetical protein
MFQLPKHLSKLEIVALFSSIVSLLVGIVGLFYPLLDSFRAQYLTLFFVSQNVIIIVALILLLGYFIRKAEITEHTLEEWRINRFEIPKSIHGFIHEMRNFFSEEYNHKYAAEQSYLQLQKACNSCKEIFDRLTKVQNTITIKMTYDKGKSFITVARDQAGIDSRGKGDKHPIAENTAFSQLAIKDKVKSKFYLNNKLHLTPHYNNTNQHWKEQYTSALVVPIRKEDVLVGCLAIDCNVQQNSELRKKKSDGFIEIYNDKNHVQLLAIFADLLYCVISKTIANQPESG